VLNPPRCFGVRSLTVADERESSAAAISGFASSGDATRVGFSRVPSERSCDVVGRFSWQVDALIGPASETMRGVSFSRFATRCRSLESPYVIVNSRCTDSSVVADVAP